MLKFLLAAMICLISLEGFAQKRKKKEEDTAPPPLNVSQAPQNKLNKEDSLYIKLYLNGLHYGDYRLSIEALHHLLAMHPDSVKYKDSLALLYSQTSNYLQCIIIGHEVLQQLPNDYPVMGAIAAADQRVGRYEESLQLYQTLYAKSPNLYAIYQIATLQYGLQRFGEAQASLDRLILNPKSAQEKIPITVNNQTQDVFYKAAAYNLMGVIYQELKNSDKARENFRKSLEIQPDFALAKQNLDYLSKSAPEKDKTPAKQAPKQKTKHS